MVMPPFSFDPIFSKNVAAIALESNFIIGTIYGKKKFHKGCKKNYSPP
jgi:hypothetical protein